MLYNFIKQNQKLGFSREQSARPHSSIQRPESIVQGLESKVQRPESRVQCPASRVQRPVSRIQHPTLASRVQEFRNDVFLKDFSKPLREIATQTSLIKVLLLKGVWISRLKVQKVIYWSYYINNLNFMKLKISYEVIRNCDKEMKLTL